MTVQRDGSDEETSSLKDIFPEAYCRTLFLPATSPKDLKNLDEMDRESLTEEYKADLAGVIAHLRDSLLRQRVCDVMRTKCPIVAMHTALSNLRCAISDIHRSSHEYYMHTHMHTYAHTHTHSLTLIHTHSHS